MRGDTDRKVRLESYQVLGKLADPDKLKEIIDLSLSATSPAERNEAERTITLVALKIENEDEIIWWCSTTHRENID